MKAYFETLILRWTHRLWNRQIARILCRAQGERLINSEQLHQLTAAFDPTQKHIVYGERVPYGFKGTKGVLSRRLPDGLKAEVNVG